MIDWMQAVLLAALQGLTEFLPISSSAHLVIPSLVLGWPDQGLAFDVAVHVGTLLAVLIYYRRDLRALASGCRLALQSRHSNAESNMVVYLACASLPVAIVGFAAGDFIEAELRSLPVIATTTALFGLLLAYADIRARRRPVSSVLTLPVAILIGLAQAIAPVPGVSRSGVTITAALLLGLDRQSAARFSFLLSIPVIGGAGLLKSAELAGQAARVDWGMLALGAGVSALTAYACIAAFLRLLDRIGLMPFVYYRLVLAAVLFLLWLS